SVCLPGRRRSPRASLPGADEGLPTGPIALWLSANRTETGMPADTEGTRNVRRFSLLCRARRTTMSGTIHPSTEVACHGSLRLTPQRVGVHQCFAADISFCVTRASPGEPVWPGERQIVIADKTGP